MTFSDFKSYKEWVNNVTNNQELAVRTLEREANSLILENMQNSDPILLMEIVLSAYDSDFILGAFDANQDNGSIIIYQD